MTQGDRPGGVLILFMRSVAVTVGSWPRRNSASSYRSQMTQRPGVGEPGGVGTSRGEGQPVYGRRVYSISRIFLLEAD